MGKVASFQIPGVECWFWSQDHHPPHFHARRRGEWEARVFFLEGASDRMIEMLDGRMAARYRKALFEAATEHRGELLVD